MPFGFPAIEDELVVLYFDGTHIVAVGTEDILPGAGFFSIHLRHEASELAELWLGDLGKLHEGW